MIMKFISHAGFALTSGHKTVMIDPWFFCSDAREPIMQGVMPPNRTIDFMVPECRDDVRDFKPDAILFSHFHTHHAPLKEAKMLIQQAGREVAIGTATLKEDQQDQLVKNLGEMGSSVRVYSVGADGDVRFEVGDMKIRGSVHTYNDHAVWCVESPSGSFLHIADAPINRDRMSRQIDPLWDKFKDLRPDVMVISAAGHCMRKENNGTRWIWENSTMSPMEAARIALLIKPKKAAVMGLYQHSQWTRRLEFPMPPEYVESAFSWSLLYLDRSIQVLTLRPGDEVTLSERTASALRPLDRQPEAL